MSNAFSSWFVQSAYFRNALVEIFSQHWLVHTGEYAYYEKPVNAAEQLHFHPYD